MIHYLCRKDKPMNHPYKAFENTEKWKIIRQAIEELIENDDLELHTPIVYVVGFICQELTSDETSTPDEREAQDVIDKS